jgi:hypothetical protein
MLGVALLRLGTRREFMLNEHKRKFPIPRCAWSSFQVRQKACESNGMRHRPRRTPSSGLLARNYRQSSTDTRSRSREVWPPGGAQPDVHRAPVSSASPVSACVNAVVYALRREDSVYDA